MSADSIHLLSEKELVTHSVVANCRMNRQRGFQGVNSYCKDLAIDLTRVLEALKTPNWLDLCCGAGRALAEAAGLFPTLRLRGLDLIAAFADTNNRVQYSVGPISGFRPGEEFGFISCVHGLHYVGDKLDALQRLSRWLADEGSFCGHLDLQSLHFEEGRHGRDLVMENLGKSGYQYDAKNRILSGKGILNFDVEFLGADPKAGPNFTGQPAVNSHYRLKSGSKTSS